MLNALLGTWVLQVTSMNSALAPSPSSYYNQSVKNPVVASTSMLRHPQPVGTSTQALATTTATNHLQSTTALQQLNQSVHQPVLHPTTQQPDQSIYRPMLNHAQQLD